VTNALRFLAVLVAFVVSISGVVWATVAAERDASARAAQERDAAHELLIAFSARETALRGFLISKDAGFLETLQHASTALADGFDRARGGADGGEAEEELRPVLEQERAAERWVGVANDMIIRARNDRPLTAQSTAIQTSLAERFRAANAELIEAVEAESELAYRRSVQRAVLLIVLLSAAFAGVGGLLLRNHRNREQDRREAESAYHASQREFTEILQVTESEAEAHAIVKRHLERTLPSAEIVVLNRNNSQNRLEAATSVAPERPLARKLVDSAPSSCLAVRLGRTHRQSSTDVPLLSCELCAEHDRTTCVPSLVGGHVIGSVLVTHEHPLEPADEGRIHETVGQAAPVLANLRNLAIAEVRAATDALTGLPNARAVRDSLVRMVAQSSRSQLPLSAVLCDLDNFKQINDVYGHDKGDQALAAASAALRGSLRESDLVGRYGGEEFLILLPDTPLDGALVLAEKLRAELALVNVPGVDRAVSGSFGVACFPDDAPDGEMLVRMADRALYAAKAGGRNCVVASGALLSENAG
jgi:diguanylate cyclase (GGDEF)-like protein